MHQPRGRPPLEYQGTPVPAKMNKLGSGGAPGSGSFLHADPVVEDAALSQAHRAAEQASTHRTAHGSATRPLFGEQTIRVHPVAVVMGDRGDDQFIGPGRIA